MERPSEEPQHGEEEAGAECAICGPGRPDEVRPLHLTHGVTVMLCGTHRRDSYLRADHGNCLAQRLSAIWRANGVATKRRVLALQTHRRQCDPAHARELPGSYSWPRLRTEAERRFAAGEHPDEVISDLRGRHQGEWANVPSIRTMKRWNHQRRWLAVTTTETGPPPQRLRPLPQPRDHHPFPWKRLKRWNMLIGSEETLFGPLACLIFEDRQPWLREDAGLGRNWEPPQRE